MKKTVLIAVAIGILVAVSGAMGLILAGVIPLGSLQAQTEGESEEQIDRPPPLPTYIPLDPAFTVSFTDEEEEAQFLQLTLSVATTEDSVEEAVAQHMPAIRNALVMLLSSQKSADLKSRDGKEKLRQKAVEEIQRVLETATGNAGVNDVFFTSFVMQ